MDNPFLHPHLLLPVHLHLLHTLENRVWHIFNMSSPPDFEEDCDTRFLLPQGVGDTEDVERYKPGGFHPVHLGDRYDSGRYRIVHKLGVGGFATVWLRETRAKRSG